MNTKQMILTLGLNLVVLQVQMMVIDFMPDNTDLRERLQTITEEMYRYE